MAFDDDIAYCIESGDYGFGVTVTWTSPALGAVTMLHDHAYTSAQVGTHAVEGTDRRVIGATADLTSVAEDSTCTIGGVTFTAKDVQPDGEGLTVVTLQLD